MFSIHGITPAVIKIVPLLGLILKRPYFFHAKVYTSPVDYVHQKNLQDTV